MPSVKDSLKTQEAIQGETENIKMLNALYRSLKTRSQWQAMTRVEHERYGSYSYEVNIFYYLADWVLPLAKELLDIQTAENCNAIQENNYD